ncbi:YcxB family protein [Apibacter sp. wkB309]|uniref:YcxB family protein n=1 Tax=Apibacter sp. wkB309 TaxID=1679467 RepID=UPI000CF8667D|nr:YcxB family protein [Apibacter sp. wkB309]PQL90203.1 hypothetical protein C4S75_09520 [Apibacter sp. wkB309]
MKDYTYTYKISADDYLTHQLFSASMNEIVKQQRKKGLLLWTSAFFVLAVIFVFLKNYALAAYFGVFGIGFIFIYPIYSRWIYKRFYKRFVYRNFNKTQLETIGLTFTTDDIILSNGENEGKIPISGIELIYEIPSHFFIKLDRGRNIIIPKSQIETKDTLTKTLTDLAESKSIPYKRMLDWKWK